MAFAYLHFESINEGGSCIFVGEQDEFFNKAFNNRVKSDPRYITSVFLQCSPVA